MSDNWSYEELQAAVQAYIEMQEFETKGQRYVKLDYYRNLAARFHRSEKSFEFRMQNISFVLMEMGRAWIPGLKPAKNVGTNIYLNIEKIIRESTSVHPGFVSNPGQLESNAESEKVLPAGTLKPLSSATTTIQYQRDQRVREWVLAQANGVCEGCGQPALFIGIDGRPYLEVHHVRQLAAGGSDTVTNAVALCPNCHREAHFSIELAQVTSRLYGRVPRLRPE